ncbi:MAG: vitamin K epoxide reductase family protein [Planctomycetota bacterium]|nr:vitamin K epoxide reductase family protein [Planctomycetota bacterium]
MYSHLSQKLIWTLRVLCSVALIISGYLAWVALNKSGVAGCGGSVFDCDHVLSSRWSNWFAAPVSLGAIGLYTLTIVALGFCGTRASERQQRFALRVLTTCGLTAGLAAVWFISLQVFAIGHFCSYCLAAHACGLLIATVILWQRPMGTGSTIKFSAVSAAGVAVLIGGQLLTPPPPTFQIEYHASAVPKSAHLPPGLVDKGDSQLFAAPDADVFEAPDFDEDVFEAPTLDD